MTRNMLLYALMLVSGLAICIGVGVARSAVPSINFVLAWSGQPVAIFPNGDVYVMNYPGGAGGWSLKSNVFGGSADGRTVVDADERLALTSTGEVFYNTSTPGNGPWINLGIPPGGYATTVKQQSWGELKRRYR